MEYHITQYELEQGALEIQYIEEYLRRVSAQEDRGRDRQPSAAAVAPDSARHRAAARRSGHGRAGLVQGRARNQDRRRPSRSSSIWSTGCTTTSQFAGRRVLYTWIGGTRRDWRGQGYFRALTEQQELWAIEQGFDEIVVKTKNKFYDMRGTLDHLRFEVVKYERQRRRQRRVEGLSEQEAAARDARPPPQREDRRPGDDLDLRP